MIDLIQQIWFLFSIQEPEWLSFLVVAYVCSALFSLKYYHKTCFLTLKLKTTFHSNCESRLWRRSLPTATHIGMLKIFHYVPNKPSRKEIRSCPIILGHFWQVERNSNTNRVCFHKLTAYKHFCSGTKLQPPEGSTYVIYFVQLQFVIEKILSL